MGTRGFIAVKTGEATFKGAYHHWDSYPEDGLGQTLLDLYHGHFAKNLTPMRALLTAHSWSTINDKNMGLAPGWGGAGAECHCCGTRSERFIPMTEENASGCGCEYGYLLEEDGLHILSSYCAPDGPNKGAKMVGFFGCGDENGVWREIALVPWTETRIPESVLDLGQPAQASLDVRSRG